MGYDPDAYRADMLRSPLADRTKLVLLLLLDHDDDGDGIVRVKRQVIADALGIHVRRVSECRNEAIEHGWLIVVGNGGFGRGTAYRFTQPWLPQLCGQAAQLQASSVLHTRPVQAEDSANCAAQPHTYGPDGDSQLCGQAAQSVRYRPTATTDGADAVPPRPSPAVDKTTFPALTEDLAAPGSEPDETPPPSVDGRTSPTTDQAAPEIRTAPPTTDVAAPTEGKDMDAQLPKPQDRREDETLTGSADRTPATREQLEASPACPVCEHPLISAAHRYNIKCGGGTGRSAG